MPKKKSVLPPRFLLIEDELPIRRALADKLERHGAVVDEAEDGEEALAMLKRHPYDMLLLDIVMPRMDGLTFLKKLRADKKHKDAKVLVITNLSAEHEKLAAARELGVHDVLIKSDILINHLVEQILASSQEP